MKEIHQDDDPTFLGKQSLNATFIDTKGLFPQIRGQLVSSVANGPWLAL
jgi:hypothetical protein